LIPGFVGSNLPLGTQDLLARVTFNRRPTLTFFIDSTLEGVLAGNTDILRYVKGL